MRNITSLGQARDYGDRLSKLLKKYRELANFRLTQGDLANRVGVSARSIRDWESGINLPTARNLKRIIEVYHTSGLFTAGKEREQAEELWILRQGEDLSNTFPLFDASWLESSPSSKEIDDKLEDKANQQSLDQTTTNSAEKNLKPIPTKLASGNLPLRLTSFIGRDKELSEIQQLLLRTRLLTITGTGGAGKTRLAQEVAHRLQESSPDSYPDGIWWVELTPVTDPQQVVQAVISALMPERRQEGDLYELLQKFLQPKKLLLVLDNCEHLVETVAGLVRKLLRDCTSLQILATSREMLNVVGEQVWLLEGLSVPGQPGNQPNLEDGENSAAVELFVERARAVHALFELTPENSGAVLSICRQLDGLPLALELAAARVKGLGIEQISRRLQQNFKLLSGGSQGNTPHHQTVQGMIDWSYNLLIVEEQLLLRRMAVFRGNFSLEAAEGVLGGDAGLGSEKLDPDDVLILMLQLVNKSLVVAVHLENNTEARYRLLEMVRQYGQEKLEASGEAAYLSYKHCAYYTGFVEKGAPNYTSDQSPIWVERLEQDVANLHSALTWALNVSRNQGQGQTALGNFTVPPAELALRLSSGLARFWQMKNHLSEGRRWLKESLALAGLADREDLKSVRALTYFYLGTYSVDQIDLAIQYLTQSLALFEEIGDKFFKVMAITNLGWKYIGAGNFAEGKALGLRSLALLEEIENKYFLGYTLLNLGVVAIVQGNLDEALEILHKSEAVHRQYNDKYAQAIILGYLAEISRIKQDLPQALSRIEESLRLFREIGSKEILLALINLSMYQHKMQNYEEARLTAEEVVANYEDETDDYFLGYAYNNLAIINFKEGNLTEARRFARLSLEIRQKISDKPGILDNLQTSALLTTAQDQWKKFVRLYSAAETLRQEMGISSNYMPEQAELDRLNEQVAHHLDPAILDRLRVKGQTDSLDDIVKQLLVS